MNRPFGDRSFENEKRYGATGSNTRRTASGQSIDAELAGFWRRVGAYAIDTQVLAIVTGLVLTGSYKLFPSGEVDATTIGAAIGLLYGIILEALPGNATLGKHILGLRVCSEGLEQPSAVQVIFRNLLKNLPSFVMIGGMFFVVSASGIQSVIPSDPAELVKMMLSVGGGMLGVIGATFVASLSVTVWVAFSSTKQGLQDSATKCLVVSTGGWGVVSAFLVGILLSIVLGIVNTVLLGQTSVSTSGGSSTTTSTSLSSIFDKVSSVSSDESSEARFEQPATDRIVDQGEPPTSFGGFALNRGEYGSYNAGREIHPLESALGLIDPKGQCVVLLLYAGGAKVPGGMSPQDLTFLGAAEGHEPSVAIRWQARPNQKKFSFGVLTDPSKNIRVYSGGAGFEPSRFGFSGTMELDKDKASGKLSGEIRSGAGQVNVKIQTDLTFVEGPVGLCSLGLSQ